MNKYLRIILKYSLALVTVFASSCGAEMAVPSPSLTLAPSKTPTETATSLATDTPSPTAISTHTLPRHTPSPMFGWSIYFRHDFEENYWKSGRHAYRIIANCPNTEQLGDFDGSHSFTIDENAPSMHYEYAVIEFVYDRTFLVSDGYNLISSVVNPRYKTRISIGYGYLTFEQAVQAAVDCQARAIIDGELKVTLLPTEPDPIHYTFYPYVRP